MMRDAHIQANGTAFDCRVEIVNPELQVAAPVKFTFRLLESDGVPVDVAVEVTRLNPTDGTEGTMRSIWLNSRKDGYRFKPNPESSSEFLATSLNINPHSGKLGFTK
jgi:hypothetical protein